jgi:hypothetical protein
MTDAQLRQLFDHISDDVVALPRAAVQLVGALVAMQEDLPPWLNQFVMAQLGARADMRAVSPAAEAVMRLSAFAAYSEMEFARIEIQTQHALLKAIALDDKVFVAATFMARLADRLQAALVPATLPVTSKNTPQPSQNIGEQLSKRY